MLLPLSSNLIDTCFSSSYNGARAAFLTAAAQARARMDVAVNNTATAPDGSVLATDIAVLGPSDAETALLIVSGTHGLEGFLGSAAQVALLHELAFSTQPLPVKLVLVHAINPYGLAHLTRTTENNVDLNRNFIDWEQGAPQNPAYAELHQALSLNAFNDEALAAADAMLTRWIEQNGHDRFVDTVAKGQYTHADGFHYGGAAREWSNHTLQRIIDKHLPAVRHLGLIDWHTGLGQHGEPFFLCFNTPRSAAWERACLWWGRDRLESRDGFDGSDRPDYQGLLFQGVQRFAAQANVVGAVIEMGTLSSAATRHALQGDLYLTNHPETLAADTVAQIKQRALEAFVPSSITWKQRALAHVMRIQQQALQGVIDWRD